MSEEATIEALREWLRSALAESDLDVDAEAILAASEPYVVLETPGERPLTAEQADYLARERAAKREMQALRKLREDRIADGERDLPLGASRFGFVPDLPPGMEWPTFEGRKLRKLWFLAQIDFSAMPRWEGCLLPKDGWLYVFVMFPTQQTDEDPWRSVVRYHRGAREELVRAEKPTADDVWGIGITERATDQLLPLTGSVGIDVVRSALDEETRAAAEYELEDIVWKVSPRHSENLDANQVSGYLLGQVSEIDGTAQSIVDDLLESRVDAAAQRVAEDPNGPGTDWMCLLTLYSAGTMQWSDAGLLYLLIRKSDLAARDFTRVCMTICSA
jgi:hypothetical protein